MEPSLVMIRRSALAVNTHIPMDGKIKNILNIVVAIVVVIWLLQAFGLLGSLRGIGIR